MSEYKSCFFIGHREADERLLPRLELVIDRLIRDEDVRYFYVGSYGGFDRIAAAAVKRAKQKYPGITLMLVLPYHPAERPTEARLCHHAVLYIRFNHIQKGADRLELQYRPGKNGGSCIRKQWLDCLEASRI